MGRDTSKLREALQRVLQRRCEDGTSSSGRPNINSLKVWQQMTGSSGDNVAFTKVRDEFCRILTEEGVDGIAAEDFCEENYSLPLKFCISLVLDTVLLFSRRPTTSTDFTFADIDGYIREAEITLLESKFYRALQVNMSKISGRVR